VLESEVEIRSGGLVATLSPEDQAEIVIGFIWIVRGQASRPTVTSLRFLERSGPRERTAEEDERVRRWSKHGRLSIVSQCASFTTAFHEELAERSQDEGSIPLGGTGQALGAIERRGGVVVPGESDEDLCEREPAGDVQRIAPRVLAGELVVAGDVAPKPRSHEALPPGLLLG